MTISGNFAMIFVTLANKKSAKSKRKTEEVTVSTASTSVDRLSKSKTVGVDLETDISP
jgi:hypothetical protein